MSQENNFIPELQPYKRLSPFRLFVKSNFPFIENTYESLDNYGLYCKVVEHLNNVIANENTVESNVQALYNAFVELNTYVSNYFDNLDVQDEINNKLDDMVEQGTLQEIISAYLNSKAIFGFDTVADMKSAENLIDGSYAKTLGYYESNDGGSALYRIRERDFEDVIDNAKLILMEDETLVAEIINENIINIKQLGAKGDGETDDSGVFKIAFNSYSTIYIPDGNYLINDKVETTTVHKVYGTGKTSKIIILSDNTIDHQDTDSHGLRFKNIENLIIKDLFFDEGLTELSRFSYNIVFETCKNVNITNLEVQRNCGTGLFFWKYCENVNIENCYIHDTKADGIHIQRGSKNFKINNCTFKDTEDDAIGFVTQGGETYGKVKGLIVTNCIIESTNTVGSGVCISGSDDVIVSNNIIKNTAYGGIRIVSKLETGDTTTFYPDNVLIQNNEIINTGLAETNLAPAIYGNSHKSVSIINNKIKTCTSVGINLNSCLGLFNINNNIIENCTKGVIITCATSPNFGDTFILNILENIIKDIETYGIQVNGGNSTLVNDNNNYVNISNNVLININTTDAGSITGITSYNVPVTRMQKNVIQTSHTIVVNYSVSPHDRNRVSDNYPIIPGTENIMIGNQKQQFMGSPPTTGKAGDVIWNWNPSNDVILWYCTSPSSEGVNATWYALKWRNQ